jgi:HNH endonuclease
VRRALTAAGGTRQWSRLVQATLVRDRYICRLTRDGHPCGAPATTADHVVSRALGGLDELSNLQASCVPCNLSKGGGAVLRGRAGTDLVDRHNALIAIVKLLDRCGVPVEAGRRRAIPALAAVSIHSWRSTDIDAACRYRRHRGPLTRV